MLDSVIGRILEAAPGEAVLDCGAFALRLRVPASSSTIEQLKVGETVRLYCHLRLREEEFSLYGFIRAGERATFSTLLSVAGLGPEKAIALLSAMPPSTIVRTIAEKDSKRFRTVRGIGDKLAQRLILELTSKLDTMAAVIADSSENGRGRFVETFEDPILRDAVATLVHLGYAKGVAESAATSALASKGRTAPLEDVIKQALRNLQQKPPTSAES